MMQREGRPPNGALDLGPAGAFLDVAPDAIVLIDAGGLIVAANPRSEHLFGSDAGGLTGKPFVSLVPDARQAGSGGRDERHLLTGCRGDGGRFPIEVRLGHFDSARGPLTIAILRDISPRHEAEALFGALLESAPDGIVVVDAEGRIRIVNGQVERMFGYARAELLGQPVELLVPERLRGVHSRHRGLYVEAPMTRPMGAGLRLTGRRRDGSEFPVEISLSPLASAQGPLVTSVIRDVTERRRFEQQIEASLREKEVLLKEIHHRVKNNLQVTSSLLRLQSARLQDPDARAPFVESQHRIRAMSLVHEQLYGAGDLSRVDLGDYARKLAELLARSYGVDRRRVSVAVHAARESLPVDLAVPVGLVLNELLSNCFKHAFPDGRHGRVDVLIEHPEGGPLSVAVNDDGVGLPDAAQLAAHGSFGLELVRTLSAQLGATLEVRRCPGTAVRLVLPEGRQ